MAKPSAYDTVTVKPGSDLTRGPQPQTQAFGEVDQGLAVRGGVEFVIAETVGRAGGLGCGSGSDEPGIVAADTREVHTEYEELRIAA